MRLFPELISSMRTTGRVVRFGRLRTWNGHVGRAGYGMAMAGTDDHGPGPGRHDGAGDGNRTRTVSLGNRAVTPGMGADLPVPSTASTRG